MTSRERAKEIADKLQGDLFSRTGWPDVELIERAITAAVEEERKSWLIMVEEVISDHLRHGDRMEWNTADSIMEAIRARGEAKKEGEK